MGPNKSPSFLPSDLGNFEAWYRFNVGITVIGAGVDTWADQSGNGNDLVQPTDSFRPSEESDGSILFDGVDNQLFVSGGFTLVQPETIYVLFKAVSWTSQDCLYDGASLNTGRFRQTTAEAEMRLFAGAALVMSPQVAVGTYHIVSAVIDGASSVLQTNNETPITGNLGSSDMSGFRLGASGDGNQPGNYQVKEVAIYSVAHDADTRTQVIDYLLGL